MASRWALETVDQLLAIYMWHRGSHIRELMAQHLEQAVANAAHPPQEEREHDE